MKTAALTLALFLACSYFVFANVDGKHSFCGRKERKNTVHFKLCSKIFSWHLFNFFLTFLGAALLEKESAQAVQSVALARHRRSTNETSSDDDDSEVSSSTATFVLNLVINIAYLVYNLVVSDLAAAASRVLAIINIVLQYVISTI